MTVRVCFAQSPVLSMATAQPEKKKERPSALRSIIAGSTAGAVEIGIPPRHEQDLHGDVLTNCC